MCGSVGLTECDGAGGDASRSPLTLPPKEAGERYSADEIMGAYRDYKYRLYKEKYENDSSD